MISLATPVMAANDTLGEVSAQMASGEVFVVQQYWGPHQNNPSRYPSSILAGTVNLGADQGGQYRIMATTLYNSDNAQYQLDESYYLSVNGQDGSAVLDNGVNPGTEVRDAGVFNFNEGLNEIYLNHYSLVSGDESYWTAQRSPSGQMMGQSVYITALTLIPVEIVTPEYQLVINKTAPSEIRLGERMTYTINWSVTGEAVAPNVVVTDVLPAEVNLISASGDYTRSGNQIIWNLGSIQANASGSMTVTVAVNEKPLVGDLIKNKATIVSSNKNSEAIAETRVIYSDLFVDKIAPSKVPAGENATYRLNWGVLGNTIAQNVVLTDSLPKEVSFVSATGDYQYNSVEHKLTWNLGTITPEARGSVEVVVRFNPCLTAGTIVYNLAAIETTNDEDIDGEETIVEANSNGACYDIAIDKIAPAQAHAGDEITYTLNWRVTGSSVANSVVVSDTLPAEVTFVSASGNYTYNSINRKITWNLGNVTPEISGSQTIKVKIASGLQAGTDIYNTADIISGAKHKNDTEVTTIVVAPSYEISINKTANKNTVNVGDNLTYTLSWSVTGNMLAPNVVVADTLPAEVSLVSATSGYVQNGRVLTWNLGDLQAEAHGTMVITVKINSLPSVGDKIVNHSVIDSGNKHAESSVETTVTVPPTYEVAISKSAPATAHAGDEITYNINYTVTGNALAQNVVVKDTLPAGVTFVSASNDYTVNGNQITWNLGDLTPTASGSMTVVVKIDSSVAPGTNLVNTVTITSGQKSATAKATTLITEIPAYEVEIDKTVNKATAYVGDELIYTLNYAVTGNTVASDVIITDTLPSEVSLVSATGNPSVSGQTLTWNLGDLQPSFTTGGDVDNDGLVDSTDALRIQAYLNNNNCGCISNFANADVNDDGQISDAD
ncbi:MAG TPA: isopeptide-forming domain-containing fimbrial protein, partial [Patescibacteria group bacterium]|nr:isopeptide-forming domain-containing fimbrial protein [Patescibacteria group bacterium]